jgi:glycerol-3-phosphate dehydrogenase
MASAEPRRGLVAWNRAWRDATWGEIRDGHIWDVIVVGGGVVGAGVARDAARRGHRTLLVEARDFAWGASSRSSKFVHGGLRYLPLGQWHLTHECVRERDRLVREAPGLVERIAFTRVLLEPERRRRLLYAAALAVYDLMSGHHDREWLDATGFAEREPLTAHLPLVGGFHFADAQTDDSRLVMRVLREAAAAGAHVRNYTTADALLVTRGRVAGVRLRDAETGADAEVTSRVVVNATGAEADTLRLRDDAPLRMRPLRGSHLVFDRARVPIARTLSFAHPVDGRNVCVTPWEGRMVVGTTDLDHDHPLDEEPRASAREVDYLMTAMRAMFAPLALEERDVIATWAGVRPVVRHGAASDHRSAAREPRDTAIVADAGIVTVTGGKLTTFRSMAAAVMSRVEGELPRDARRRPTGNRAFDEVSAALAPHATLDAGARRRIVGRHGADAPALVAAARTGELAPLDGTCTSAAELRWAARAEGVVHLDDLLLRRTRLGVLDADGGRRHFDVIRPIAQHELGWSDERWHDESTRYLALHRTTYGIPRA